MVITGFCIEPNAPLAGSSQGSIEREMDSLRREITELSGEIAKMRGELMGMRGDVIGVRGEILGLRGELVGLRGVLMSIRADMASFQIAVREVIVSLRTAMTSNLFNTMVDMSRHLETPFTAQLNAITSILENRLESTSRTIFGDRSHGMYPSYLRI
jgi:hypothetical protein